MNKKNKIDIDIIEQKGLDVIRNLALYKWRCKWQDIHISVDNVVSLDGILFIVNSKSLPEDAIYVQVKSGESYRKVFKKIDASNRDYITLQLGDLEKYKERWNSISANIILIYVDPSINPDNPPAWWVNVKDSKAYTSKSKTYLRIPKCNKLTDTSLGEIKRKVCRYKYIKPKYLNEKIEISDINYLTLNNSIRNNAKEFYKKHSGLLLNPNNELGNIIINRVGWRHITRKSRKKERIIQSLSLLGVAFKIIKENSIYQKVGRIESSKDLTIIKDYLVLKNIVVFPHRQETIVTVVLRRHRKFDLNGNITGQKIWFYTVYESLRGIKKN